MSSPFAWPAIPAFVEPVGDLNVRRSVRGIVNRSFILEQLIGDRESLEAFLRDG